LHVFKYLEATIAQVCFKLNIVLFRSLENIMKLLATVFLWYELGPVDNHIMCVGIVWDEINLILNYNCLLQQDQNSPNHRERAAALFLVAICVLAFSPCKLVLDDFYC
jgi:hypothetical protein